MDKDEIRCAIVFCHANICWKCGSPMCAIPESEKSVFLGCSSRKCPENKLGIRVSWDTNWFIRFWGYNAEKLLKSTGEFSDNDKEYISMVINRIELLGASKEGE